jgi:hypothetical protein
MGNIRDKEIPSLETRFRKGQVIRNGKNITRKYERTTEEACQKILRMLVSQYALLRWLPEPKEILELTNGLCKAIEDTHRFFLGNASSLLRWTQYMVLCTTSSLDLADDRGFGDQQKIVGIELNMSNISLDETACRLVQSMISLSWYHYNRGMINWDKPRESYYIKLFGSFHLGSKSRSSNVKHRCRTIFQIPQVGDVMKIVQYVSLTD